jgi:hypothetical protein
VIQMGSVFRNWLDSVEVENHAVRETIVDVAVAAWALRVNACGFPLLVLIVVDFHDTCVTVTTPEPNAEEERLGPCTFSKHSASCSVIDLS